MSGQPAHDHHLRVSTASHQLSGFDFAPRTRVVFGSGTLSRLGPLAEELGGRHVLLVSDKGLARAGHEKHALESLRGSGIEVTVFDDVQPNPTTEDVDRGLKVARAHPIDLIVGLGGGSSMDCAKGINFLLTNGGRMQDYHGVGKARKPMLPMIAIPTTAGTGSEAQSFALIADAETHMKMACGDKKAACAIAILDPTLTVSLPRSVTAATGIDALSHALETYVTRPRNAVSQMFSQEAWRRLARGFPRVLADGEDIEARGEMLLGAHLAGAAIENSMLGATHALANPLSAHHGVTHGTAIGVMLPHVIRFNSQVVAPLYGHLAELAELCEADDPAAASRLADFVSGLVDLSGSPTTLAACNIERPDFDRLARDAAAQWTGTFNPRPVNPTDFKELYQCALNGDGRARRGA